MRYQRIVKRYSKMMNEHMSNSDSYRNFSMKPPFEMSHSFLLSAHEQPVV